MYTIVGYKDVNYKRKDGSQCVGVEFHLLESDCSSVTLGQGVATVFLSQNALIQSRATDFDIGDFCELRYQLSGRAPRLVGINLIPQDKE